MNKGKRRWWLIALLVAVVVAAAITAGVFLLNRGKSSGVHYLTSTAVTGTISETVQADFTLTNSSDALTISLGGTSSSSSASSGSGVGTTAIAHGGLATAPITLDRTIIADGVSTPAPTASPTSVPAPSITALIPTSGPVNSSVTLVGTGFTGATAIAFHGRAARFIVNSDTQITTTVPAGATSGPLSVTAPGGVVTSATSFRVTPTPKIKPTPSRSHKPSAEPTASQSSGSSSSGTSFAGKISADATSTGSGSTASSGGSTASSGVVTGIPFAAGQSPSTLEHLLTISGKPIYAFVSPSPLYVTLSTSLASGDQRSNVAALQRALRAAGYFTDTVNGDFGATTQTALEDWQAARGLSETGEVTTAQFVWVPKGAVIESWNVSLGGRVSTNTALATIDYPRDLVAQAPVPQADISSLKVGQKAALTIDGVTSDPFSATITSIANQPSSSSSTGSSSSSSSTVDYTVDLVPHGLPSLAKSGMTGSLTVTIASRSNVLLVPTSAVSGSSSASFVRVMTNGTPTYRQVTTGMTTSSLTQITSGLTAGEVVVTGTYTNSATTNSGTSTTGGFSGLGGFSGGGSFRRSTSGGGAFFGGGSASSSSTVKQ